MSGVPYDPSVWPTWEFAVELAASDVAFMLGPKSHRQVEVSINLSGDRVLIENTRSLEIAGETVLSVAMIECKRRPLPPARGPIEDAVREALDAVEEQERRVTA